MSDIREICHTDCPTIRPEASIADAARRMSATGEDVLLVSTRAGILGLVSDRDIVVLAVAKGVKTRNTPVEQIMRVGLPACSTEVPLEDVARLMLDKQVRQIYVFEKGQFVGIVRVQDVLGCL